MAASGENTDNHRILIGTSCTGKVVSTNDLLKQIMEEFDQKINDLASLTAQLPDRLKIGGSRPRTPSSSIKIPPLSSNDSSGCSATALPVRHRVGPAGLPPDAKPWSSAPPLSSSCSSAAELPNKCRTDPTVVRSESKECPSKAGTVSELVPLSKFQGDSGVSPRELTDRTFSADTTEPLGAIKHEAFHSAGSLLRSSISDMDTLFVPTTDSDNVIFSQKILQCWEEMLVKLKMSQMTQEAGFESEHDDDAKSLGAASLGTAAVRRLVCKSHREGERSSKRWWSFLVSRPLSVKRLLWEIIGISLVMFDLASFPFVEAFQVERTPWMDVLGTVSTSFWAIDLVLRFFQGYYHKDGTLELRLHMTAPNYLKTSFLFDATIVGLDVSWTFQDGNRELIGALRFFKLGKVARLSRAFRAMRLLRMMKFHSMFSEVMLVATSEVRLIGLKFARLIVIILSVNHLVACIWWAIGVSGYDGSLNFVNENQLQNRTLMYKYLTCLHWAVCQFTPASMEVTPRNTLERAFAIMIVMFGMVAFSSCISSITNLAMQLKNHGSQNKVYEFQLRRFLNQNRISLGLSQQVWSFLKLRNANEEDRIREEDVELLHRVPDMLMFELHSEIYMPTLVGHPFFHSVSWQDPGTMQFVCNVALHSTVVNHGQEFFHKGQRSKGMAAVHSGSLVYSLAKPRMTLEASSQPSQHSSVQFSHLLSGGRNLPTHASNHLLSEGAWLSEASLWVSNWIHCGWLVALKLSELFVIDREKFHEHLETHPCRCCTAVRKYQLYFQSLMSDVGVWHDNGITDINPTLREVTEITNKAFKEMKERNGMKKETKVDVLKHRKNTIQFWELEKDKKPFELTDNAV